MTPSTLRAVEGETVSVTVVLTSAPASTATFEFGEIVATHVSVDPPSLEFTTTNWNEPQTVRVTMVEEDDVHAVDEFDRLIAWLTIGGTRTSRSDVLRVYITDNDKDAPAVRLVPQALRVAEGGDSSYTVRLSAQPTAAVTVTISGTTGTDLTLDKTSLSFNNLTWGIPQTVTVSATDDNDADDDVVTLPHMTASSGDDNWDGVPANLLVTVADDEQPGRLVINSSSLTVAEGDNTSYWVRLSSEPTAAVTVTISGTTDTDLSLDKTLLMFSTSNWNEIQTVTVTAGQDGDPDLDTATLLHTASGGNYEGVTASISVTTTDDDGTMANSSPAFGTTTATRSVAENTAADTNIGAALTATDADAADTLTYTLGGTNAAAFQIVSSSGQLQTKAGVSYDHETKDSYAVTVSVSDGQGGTDSIAVTINVTDVNEPPAAPAAPTVTAASRTSLSVSWTAPTNTGKPAITDYDVQYRTGTDDYAAWAHSGTGTSATITGLTHGTSYDVQVKAKNAEGESGWSAAGSGSTSANSAPTFTAGETATRSVAENTAAGTNIGAALAATDTDTADTLTYTLGGDDAASFEIVATSGQLQTKAALDHEAKASYAVTVGVEDDLGASDSIAVTINVTDVNEPPATPAAPTVTAASRTSLSVSWTAPTNTGKPAITDYDVQYRTGTDDYAAWAHSGTGTSATITGLTHGTSYDVQVKAKNAEGESGWSAAGSGSTSANSAPTFTAGETATRSVAENTATGANIGAALAATDADAADTLTYTLGGTNAAAFQIVSSSGQLQTKAGVSYDHETKDSYAVTVSVSDGQGGTDSVAVTISVTDVDEPPATPAAPTVTAASRTSLSVSWTAPTNTGKPPITDYDVQYRTQWH